MARLELDPQRSKVWIEGSSTLHPVRATAAGLTGWIELGWRSGRPTAGSGLAGEVRIAVDQLRSGNPLVDRETRRRIDAGRHPEIVGTAVSAERLSEDRFAVSGDIAFRGEVVRTEGELEVRVEQGRLLVEGTQRLDVRDWGLQPPRVGLLRVHPDIEVRIRLVAPVPGS